MGARRMRFRRVPSGAGGSAGDRRADEAPTAAPSPAEAALTVDQVLDNMEAVRKKIKTFKADVVKLRQATGLDDSHFTGTIQFKSPRLLKLDLKNTETGAETISYVGQKFGWVYRPQEKRPQAERIRLADIDKDKKAGNPLEYGLARDMHGLRDGYTLKLLPMEKVGDAADRPARDDARGRHDLHERPPDLLDRHQDLAAGSGAPVQEQRRSRRDAHLHPYHPQRFDPGFHFRV